MKLFDEISEYTGLNKADRKLTDEYSSIILQLIENGDFNREDENFISDWLINQLVDQHKCSGNRLLNIHATIMAQYKLRLDETLLIEYSAWELLKRRLASGNYSPEYYVQLLIDIVNENFNITNDQLSEYTKLVQEKYSELNDSLGIENGKIDKLELLYKQYEKYSNKTEVLIGNLLRQQHLKLKPKNLDIQCLGEIGEGIVTLQGLTNTLRERKLLYEASSQINHVLLSFLKDFLQVEYQKKIIIPDTLLEIEKKVISNLTKEKLTHPSFTDKVLNKFSRRKELSELSQIQIETYSEGLGWILNLCKDFLGHLNGRNVKKFEYEANISGLHSLISDIKKIVDLINMNLKTFFESGKKLTKHDLHAINSLYEKRLKEMGKENEESDQQISDLQINIDLLVQEKTGNESLKYINAAPRKILLELFGNEIARIIDAQKLVATFSYDKNRQNHAREYAIKKLVELRKKIVAFEKKAERNDILPELSYFFSIKNEDILYKLGKQIQTTSSEFKIDSEDENRISQYLYERLGNIIDLKGSVSALERRNGKIEKQEKVEEQLIEKQEKVEEQLIEKQEKVEEQEKLKIDEDVLKNGRKKFAKLISHLPQKSVHTINKYYYYLKENKQDDFLLMMENLIEYETELFSLYDGVLNIDNGKKIILKENQRLNMSSIKFVKRFINTVLFHRDKLENVRKYLKHLNDQKLAALMLSGDVYSFFFKKDSLRREETSRITDSVISQLRDKVIIKSKEAPVLIKVDALLDNDEDKNTENAKLEKLAMESLSITTNFNFQTAIKMVLILKSLKKFKDESLPKILEGLKNCNRLLAFLFTGNVFGKSLLGEVEKFRPKFKLKLDRKPTTLFDMVLLLNNVILNEDMVKKGVNKLNKLKMIIGENRWDELAQEVRHDNTYQILFE